MTHTRLNIPRLIPIWDGDKTEPDSLLVSDGIAENELMPPKDWNWLLNNQNSWLDSNALSSLNSFRTVTTGLSNSRTGVWDPIFKIWFFGVLAGQAYRSAFGEAFAASSGVTGSAQKMLIDKSGRVIYKSILANTFYSTNGSSFSSGTEEPVVVSSFYNMDSAYPFSDKLVSVSTEGIYKADSVVSPFSQPSLDLPAGYNPEDVKHVRGSFWLVLGRSGSSAKIFQSFDNGDTWKDLGVIVNAPVSGPKFDINTESQRVILSNVFSGSYHQAYVSEDYGINWRTVVVTGYEMDTLNDVVHCGGPVWLMLGDVRSFPGLGESNPGLISIDDGETWQPINSDSSGIGKAAFINNSQIIITLENSDILLSDHIFGGW